MTIYHEPTMPTGIYVFEADLTERDVDTLRRISAEARADALREAAKRVRALDWEPYSFPTEAQLQPLILAILDPETP
jgi:hypothetical protein